MWLLLACQHDAPASLDADARAVLGPCLVAYVCVWGLHFTMQTCIQPPFKPCWLVGYGSSCIRITHACAHICMPSARGCAVRKVGTDAKIERLKDVCKQATIR